MSDSRPLRVHFFTNFCHPTGTYFRSHNLAVALARLGHEVAVFAADFDTDSRHRSEIRDGVVYTIVPEWRGLRLFGGGCHPGTAIERGLSSYGSCDVVHLFQPFPSAAAAWLAASREARVRCFDWDDLWHGGLLDGGPASVRKAWLRLVVGQLERRLPGSADYVTTCSAYLAHLAAGRGASGATVIPNGYWPSPVPSRHEARCRLGLDPQAWYAGLMGRNLRELDWCFAGFERASVRHDRLRLAVCGYPPGALGSLAPGVRSRVDDLGELPAADLQRFVAAIDFGLLPLEDTPFNRSRFPIKFAEYLGGGAPVLVSAVGECALVSRDMPWVFPAGTGLRDWVLAFEAVAGRLEAGLPAVDQVATSRVLSWQRAAATLENTYVALLRS